MSKGESRSYLIGLPVLVTVWDDGTVIYDVATEEAGEAVREEYVSGLNPQGDPQLRGDVERIEADHERRREGEESEPLSDPCVECEEAEAEEHGMCGSCLHNAYRSGWQPGGES